MSSRSIAFALLAVGFVTTAARFAASSDPVAPASAAPQQEGGDDMAKMMEAAKKWTAPSASHKKLERFVGKWDVTSTMGGQPVGKSKAEFTSILGGRFVKGELKGQFWINANYESLYLLGYDNFKHAYVQTSADNMNTMLLEAQGVADQTGDTLILYGKMDEYLTGEIGKEVKYVYRWKDDDQFAIEVHDLAIGETNTKVVEMQYTRAK
jgi:Protein of unknown function (DUF1579)